jgi:hypothetical protein
MKFPDVTGSNLLRQKITLPHDLQGILNILLIAFQQRHQALVDSWIPFLSQLEQSTPKLLFYELPVIQKLHFISQTFINEGMRAGIPNRNTRQKTITLYLDKPSFRNALDIPNEETIWVLLVDQPGNVLWRIAGPYTPEKGRALGSAVQNENDRLHLGAREADALDEGTLRKKE